MVYYGKRSQSQRGRFIGGCEGLPNAKLSLSWGCLARPVSVCCNTLEVCQPGKLTRAGYFIGAPLHGHTDGWIDWLIPFVVELSFQQLPFSRDQADATWSEQLTLRHLISINYQVYSKGLTVTSTDTPSFTKFKGFRRYLPGARDEGQPSTNPLRRNAKYHWCIL